MQRTTRWTAGSLIVAGAVGLITVNTIGQDRPGTSRPGQDDQRQQDRDRPMTDQSFPKPVVETHDLMNLFNKPAYMKLCGLLAKEGATLDSDQWMEVTDEAHRVAEAANLVAIRKDAREFDQWEEHARQLQQSAMVLARAAEQRNDMEVRNAFRTMVNNCNTCHQATRPDKAPMLDPSAPGGVRQQPGDRQPQRDPAMPGSGRPQRPAERE